MKQNIKRVSHRIFDTLAISQANPFNFLRGADKSINEFSEFLQYVSRADKDGCLEM